MRTSLAAVLLGLLGCGRVADELGDVPVEAGPIGADSSFDAPVVVDVADASRPTDTTSAADTFAPGHDALPEAGTVGLAEWTKLITSSASVDVTRVLVSPGGDVVAAGYFRRDVDFGMGAVAKDNGLFVVEYDALVTFTSDGKWARQSVFDDRDAVLERIDAARSLFFGVVGSNGSLDLGTGPIGPTGPDTVIAFVGRMDSFGTARWTHTYGGVPYVLEVLGGFATDEEESAYVSGALRGRLSFGDGCVEEHGGFVVKYDASGRCLWSWSRSTPDSIGNADVTSGGDGRIYLGMTGNPASGGAYGSVAALARDGTGVWGREFHGTNLVSFSTLAWHSSRALIVGGRRLRQSPLLPERCFRARGDEMLQRWSSPTPRAACQHGVGTGRPLRSLNKPTSFARNSPREDREDRKVASDTCIRRRLRAVADRGHGSSVPVPVG